MPDASPALQFSNCFFNSQPSSQPLTSLNGSTIPMSRVQRSADVTGTCASPQTICSGCYKPNTLNLAVYAFLTGTRLPIQDRKRLQPWHSILDSLFDSLIQCLGGFSSSHVRRPITEGIL